MVGRDAENQVALLRSRRQPSATPMKRSFSQVLKELQQERALVFVDHARTQVAGAGYLKAVWLGVFASVPLGFSATEIPLDHRGLPSK